MDTSLKPTVELTLPSTAGKDLGFNYQLTLAFIPSLASYGLQSWGRRIDQSFLRRHMPLGRFLQEGSLELGPHTAKGKLNLNF